MYVISCVYSTGTGVPSSGSTLGHQLNFCFTQRRLSLHWTVKCSNLFLLGPDASWMAVKIAAGLWYMGFPVLTLGSPFLLHIITKAYTLSQRGNVKCSVATRLRRVRITGTILCKRNWNVSRVSCCIEPRPCAMRMCCFWLDTLYYCACFPVGLWRFSFLVFLLRWPDFRAGGKWDHGCRSKNQ